jgi:predicted nucleic acid-binding protein
MKVLFDANVYVAEALLGHAATRMIDATVRAGWRIYVSPYLLDELPASWRII